MSNKNLTTLFKRLKKVLAPYSEHFTVRANDDNTFDLVGTTPKNKAKRFGAVVMRENYVTFYSCPTILSQASPALREQMDGSTSSVKLTEVDQALIDEIATLTEIRYQGYLATGSY